MYSKLLASVVGMVVKLGQHNAAGCGCGEYLIVRVELDCRNDDSCSDSNDGGREIDGSGDGHDGESEIMGNSLCDLRGQWW